jgi:hypothetical protein
MKKLLILSFTLISPFALASELNVPNQFEDGQVTSAEQMNANFEAIQAAVNDNHARIESMQQPTKAVFQGFSMESMNGGQGLIAMQQACHNFVHGSHICNITEFAESSYNPQAVENMTGSAWILSNFSVNGDSSHLITDKNGIGRYNIYYTVSCNAWTDQSSNSEGTSINDKGDFTKQQCSSSFKVACCK